MNYETSGEIEIVIAGYFSYTRNVIVPNLSWGMFPYELDVCILNTKTMYATEVEIKISKSDLKRDAIKTHHHDRNGNLIRQLWFAMPEKMGGCEDLVPANAGILYITKGGRVYAVRQPQVNKLAKKWTYEDAFKLARLGTIRVWNLKRVFKQKEQYIKDHK